MQVNPVHSDGRPLGDTTFVRTGLLGFLGPVSNVTVCFCCLCNEQVQFCYILAACDRNMYSLIIYRFIIVIKLLVNFFGF